VSRTSVRPFVSAGSALSVCRLLYPVTRAAPARGAVGQSSPSRDGAWRWLSRLWPQPGRKNDWTTSLPGSRAAAAMQASTQFLRAGIAHF